MDDQWSPGADILPGVPLPPMPGREPVAPEAPRPAPPAADVPQPQPEPVAVAVPETTEPADPAPMAPSTAPVVANEVAPAPPVAVHGRHRAPAPEPTGPGSRRLLVLLAVLVVVLAVAAVAAFVWPGLLRSSDTPEALPAPTRSASPSTTASASVATVTLVTPKSIAGLARQSGAGDTALRATVAKTAVAGLTAPVSAVYGTSTSTDVQVIAWKATTSQAPDSVDAAFTGFEGSAATAVTEVQDVPTGALGGRMACGLATVSSTPALLCFWSDELSFGSVTVIRPASRQAGTTLATAVRTAVEQKTVG